MTASSRGRVAVAALIAVVVFAAAFAVRRASAGETQAPKQPAPVVLPSTPVHASGIALPASAAVPALHRAPRPAAPSPSTSPSPSTTPAPSAPAAPSKPSAPSGGPVLVG